MKLLPLLLCLLLPLAARADEPQRRAREHFALAEAAERRGDFATAIDEYKLAYAIKAHPVVLYDIAVDYEKLEQWDASVDYYRRYLTDSPDAPDKARVRAKVGELEQRLAASRPPPPRGEGTLTVEADVEARVLVDGTDLGKTPLHLAVPAGHHRISLLRDGYGQVEREVDVGPGGTEQVKEKLPRLPGTPDPTAVEHRSYFSLGLDYGFDYVPSFAMRVVVCAAFHMLDEHLELGALYGYYGTGNLAFGGEARGYFSTRALRPYARAAITAGKADDGSSVIGGEASGGVLFAPSAASGGTSLRLQYTVEAGVRYLFSGAADSMSTDHRPQVAVSMSVGFLVPF